MKFSTGAVLFTFFGSFALAHLKGRHDVIYDDTAATKRKRGGGVKFPRSGRTDLKVGKQMVSIFVLLWP